MLLISVLGLYLRFAAVIDTRVDTPIRADAREYYLTAYNLTKYGIYSMSDAKLRDPAAPLHSDSFRWPGLPLIIASFMADWPEHRLILREVQLVNVALALGTLVLLGAVAATVLPVWAALAAALLTAISPHLVSISVYILTETPGAFFVALVLAVCAAGPPERAERPAGIFVLLGISIGLLAMFRPLFAAFAPLPAIALSKSRFKGALLLIAGAALPLTPWLIRNAVFVPPGTTPSSLAMTMMIGAYPGYMFNGDPATFPFPQSYDPDFAKFSANVFIAFSEIWRRIAADPLGMAKWYFLGKPPYLWQFTNIDGAGDVFVYPVSETPFKSNPLFTFTHDSMQILHWPIVFLAAAGSILVWWRRAQVLLPESRGLVLRTASLLLIFLTTATLPLNNPARFAVPVLPALFLMAMVALVMFGRFVLHSRLCKGPQ